VGYLITLFGITLNIITSSVGSTLNSISWVLDCGIFCYGNGGTQRTKNDAAIIFVSEQEEICSSGQTLPTPTPTITQNTTPTNTPTNTNTPSVTPTNTATPSHTPTNTPTPSSTPPVPYFGFIVGSGSTFGDACNNLSIGNTFIAYANIAGGQGQCNPCVPQTCFACVNTTDTWWLDAAFTIPLPDMWIANYISPPLSVSKRLQIVNQMIVGGTFTDC
jgi:hypothetical protein